MTGVQTCALPILGNRLVDPGPHPAVVLGGEELREEPGPVVDLRKQIKRRSIIDIYDKDITKRKPSTYKCLSNLKRGKKSLRAYGGCLGFQRRRRTW